jgi:hypothetical protein
MIIAIRECHTYKRWQVVHNFLSEKLPGLPLINKLRVIHIYEADWSLIQRFYVALNSPKKHLMKILSPLNKQERDREEAQ